MNRLILTITMADGTEHADLAVNNPAMVAWDFERSAKKWPTATDAPFLWMTFLAWRQLVTSGDYTGTFVQFRDVDCIDVDKADEVSVDVDPTNQAAVPVSALRSVQPQDST